MQNDFWNCFNCLVLLDELGNVTNDPPTEKTTVLCCPQCHRLFKTELRDGAENMKYIGEIKWRQPNQLLWKCVLSLSLIVGIGSFVLWQMFG